MPACTRSRNIPPRTRNGRRNNTKRIILGAVSENQEVHPADYSEAAKTGILVKAESHTNESNTDGVNSGKLLVIPNDFDGSSAESVNVLLLDIETKLKKLQEIIHTTNRKVVEEQNCDHFCTMMSVPKKIRNMPIADFNRNYLEEGENIIDLIGSIADDANNNNSCISKKRVRTGQNNTVKSTAAMELETPSRNIRSTAEFRTPGTLARSVKRGEILYSINGSPVDRTEEGDLVATVSKKRRGNDAAVFDIDVGDGRYISLSDPSSVQHLDAEMKSTAKSQLKVMQDQMTMLMAKLGN